jgi:hypothetical protein
MANRLRNLRLLATPGCLILIISTCVLGYLLGRLFFENSFKNEPNTVQISLLAPETAVPAGQPFVVTVQVNNSVAEEQLLHSIDISDGYLEKISLQRSTPAFDRELAIPFVRFQSFQYGASIRGRGVQRVEFTFIGDAPGEFAGEIDVCINSGSVCKLFPLATTIGE